MNKFDLEKRTLDFSKKLLSVLQQLNKNEANRILINQLMRSGTSVGANYREANGATSRKDFKNKIHISKKEAQESQYWLELLIENNQKNDDLISLKEECAQLVKIFGKITATLSREN